VKAARRFVDRAAVGCLALLMCAASAPAATPASSYVEQWNGVWERFKVGASGFPDAENPGELKDFSAAVRAAL
jgi:hypothetical protein